MGEGVDGIGQVDAVAVAGVCWVLPEIVDCFETPVTALFRRSYRAIGVGREKWLGLAELSGN